VKEWRIARALAWGAASAPALAGATVAVLSAVGGLPNADAYVRGPLGTLALLGGGLLSSVALAIVWLAIRARDGYERGAVGAMAQAAEDRRRFLRRLDHELKNPLTAMRAGLANLAWVSSEQERRQALQSVEAQALRLSRLAADLRKLAELETRPLERTAVDVAALLREAVEVAREQPGAAERRLTLTLPQAPWPLPSVSGDPDLLFLAVHNLLNNALKFTKPGDTIEVRGYEDGAVVVVEVADTGPGIPEDELPHIWEELYRGRGARGIPGSGLGLALVRAIVDRHGGQAVLRSRIGQGTLFTLRLPQGR
jgi:two-component system OmpR family sensor kinase